MKHLLKPVCWLLLPLGLTAGLTSAPGRAENAAAEAAQRQEAEERYQKVRAKLEETLEAQAVLQKRLSALGAEMAGLRQEMERSGGNQASHEDLRKLAEAVREVDKRREDDRKLILEEIRRLAAQPPPEQPTRKPAKAVEAEPAPISGGAQKGYEYEVKSGDTISTIVAAYQANGVKVTVPQVIKANPGVNPNKMRKGQKIFIPDPAAK